MVMIKEADLFFCDELISDIKFPVLVVITSQDG